MLAARLEEFANRPDVLVLALPRGGVAVGFEVATALHVPLDVLIVRKLGVPGQEELAMGAIAAGGVRVLNEDVVRYLGIPQEVIDRVTAREQQEVERREHIYRDDRPLYDVRGRTIILVDDGIATGATMHAAVEVLKKQQPARLIIAVPTAAPSTCAEFEAEGVEVISLIKPEPFYGVGYWYDNFSQMTDEEVHHLLDQAAHEQAATPQAQENKPATRDHEQRGESAPPAGYHSSHIHQR